MSARAKRLEYSASVDRSGRISTGGQAPLRLAEAWSPEALVLAGLARCTIASLAYHARRANLTAAVRAEARGAVTKRDDDGRYAFVELECDLDAELEPAPAGEELAALLSKAERDCFVGASLTVATRYRWRVNGEDV